MPHSVQIVFACEDPNGLAADAHEIPRDRRDDISAVVDPAGNGPRLLFERYDGGQPNQRVHIDVNSIGGTGLTDDQRRTRLAEERGRLETLGATDKRETTGMAGEIRIELFDTEGNWFCVQ